MGGAGVLLLYSAYHKRSPFTAITDVIGGEKAKPTTATFKSLNTAPLISGGSKAATAVAFALSKIGLPYSHSPDGVTSFDCSLLVQKALASAGVSIPRTTYDQVKGGINVDPANIQPGDLIFYQGLDENGIWRDFGHVTMAIGGGMQVEAPRTGELVQTNPIRFSAIQAVRRYTQ